MKIKPSPEEVRSFAASGKYSVLPVSCDIGNQSVRIS